MNSSKEFNCVFCKETFNNKEDLQIHFRKHGDPKFNPNSKNYKSTPQNESASNVENSNSAREMVSCDVCSEEFPTISKAITHKHKVHPNHDTKYFCPWCGKLFTMMHLYNKHVLSNHSKVLGTEVAHNNMFHCEPCQVTFYLPGAMLYHNKFFHRQDTEMPAIGHSKLQKFINQELMPIYYCPFCGEEYINKVNLHTHMAIDHSDENQSPEEVLRCPLCDALFYHLDAYEVHLTLHSSDDVYREVNEMNKNVKDITEYTLESVPPLREKVEDMESQENDVNSMSAMGLEEFLQVAMTSGEQDDEEHPRKRMKVKKSKKHKKSKKTITLDEFLNMNKDVFGEGLGDVQGIEEVPTQVVAKQLKRKVQQPLKSGTKLMSSDIEKLKKQGIVIKMKSKHNKVPGVSPNSTPPTTEKKTSNEVLSKLLNQSNNQIKITKTQNTQGSEATDRPVTPKNEILNNSASTLEKTSVNCDTLSESDNIPVPDKERTLEGDSEPSKNENKLRHSSEANVDKVSQCTENIAKSEDDTDVNTESDLEEKIDEALQKNKKANYASETNSEREPVLSKPIQEKTEVVASKTDIRCSTPNNLEKLKKLGHLTIKTSNLKKETSLNVPQTPTEVLNDECASLPVTDCSSLGSLKQSRDDMCIKYSICDSERKSTAKNDRESPIHKSENSDVINNKEHYSDTNDNDCPVSKIKSVLPFTEDSSKDDTSIKTSLFKKLYDQLTIKSANQASFIDREKQPDDVSNGRKTPQLSLNNVEVTNDKSLDIVKNINSNITIKSISKLPVSKSQIKVEQADSDEDSSKGKTELVTDKVNPNCVVKSDLLKSALKNIGSGISIRSTNLNKEAIDQNYHKSMDNLTKCTPKVFKKDLVASSSSELSKKMPSPVNKKIDTNIEIFDIDDSDDEPTIPKPNVNKNLQHSISSNVTCMKSVSQQQSSQVEAIKKIGHNITVRSSNVSSVVKHESIYSEHSNDSKEISGKEIQKQKNTSNALGNNENVQKVLKNLGKHISIKSRNSSPSSSKNDDNCTRESFSSAVNKADEHSNSGDSQIKIQDVTDDYNSDEETENNMNVESPKDSEDENFDEENVDEDLLDVESQIKATQLEKINPSFIKTLKNISKNITVKSLNDKKIENSTNLEQNTNKDIVLHNPNKIIDAIQSTDSINKQIKNQGSHSFNKAQRNTKALNETNQEVTVKRFETNTVIQEITTTVTKTIRTVNQTFHKEIQSSSQVTRPRSVAPTFRPNTKFNAFQGVKVRPAATTPVPRLRNPSNIIRPQMPPPVRPPQQLVPVRMSSNTARLSRPRMPANPQKNNPVTVGKQLKVSPNVNINATVKRAAAEEVGHFSCFKKPKESLIPVPDLTMASDMDGTSTENYSSTHTSKTDFTTASKTIKGNSVVTSMQMKSEASVNSQNLSRKGNMTGLKVTKSNQVKQASSHFDKTEVDSSRMSTLAAIDKLQKQGLLIKKPRLESNIDDLSSHSCDEA